MSAPFNDFLINYENNNDDDDHNDDDDDDDKSDNTVEPPLNGHPQLRASFCKYRESGDSLKIFNFLIFCSNKAFSELFSKIQLKDPKALEFFQNRGKFENRHFGLPPPLKIDKNDAFSFRSCW